MKTYLDCIPCFMQQALRAGRLTTNDENKQKQILDEVGNLIQTLNMKQTPAEYGAEVYRIISEITGVKDPYRQIKICSIKEAKELIPGLRSIIEKSEDPLLTSVKAAIAGNVIDFGVNQNFDLKNDLKKILIQDFAISDYGDFKTAVENAKTILYIGDNAGETVFDKLLIEQINKKTYYAVREIPIINDVNSEIEEVAEIITSGVKAPGAITNQFNKCFSDLFQTADLIISKGQGNYEGLSGVSRSVFFLLKAKCEIIADDIGVKLNDIILKGINISKNK